MNFIDNIIKSISDDISKVFKNSKLIPTEVPTNIVYHIAVEIKYPQKIVPERVWTDDNTKCIVMQKLLDKEVYAFIVDYKVPCYTLEKPSINEIIDYVKENYKYRDEYKEIIESHKDRDDFIVDIYETTSDIEYEDGYKIV